MENVLLTKGIILQSGEVNKDKINLAAGAITQPFAEMVWLTPPKTRQTWNADIEKCRTFSIRHLLFSRQIAVCACHSLRSKYNENNYFDIGICFAYRLKSREIC